MNRTPEEALENAQPMIDALIKGPCTPGDLIDIMHLEHNKNSNSRIVQMIGTLSKHLPVFEPSKMHYQILTKEILDQYEEEHAKKVKIETYDWE